MKTRWIQRLLRAAAPGLAMSPNPRQPRPAQRQAPRQSCGPSETFVAGLYEAYSEFPEPDYLGKDAPAAFTPALAELIHGVQRHSRGRVPPGLEGDPLCGGQNPFGLEVTDLWMEGVGATRALALVNLRWTSGEKRRVRLDLVASPKGWRVANVHSARTPNLLATLTAARH